MSVKELQSILHAEMFSNNVHFRRFILSMPDDLAPHPQHQSFLIFLLRFRGIVSVRCSLHRKQLQNRRCSQHDPIERKILRRTGDVVKTELHQSVLACTGNDPKKCRAPCHAKVCILPETTFSSVLS